MRTKIHAILGGVCAPLLLATPALGEEVHWPLQDSIWNSSGAVPRLLNHGVVFDVPAPDGSRAARFDGVSAFLERRENWAPAFFVGDFTVSVEVFVEEPLDDAPGDILGCFDPDTRRGLNFGIASHSGVANSQPNHRNVYFGVDNGKLETDWTDCGRPGQAVFVFGFAVHDGALYAATCEAHEGGAGHVWRYAGGDRWEDCGSPDGSNAVAALAVHDGALYAGTSRYDTTGSAMAASPNTTPGGRVYRYDGGTAWTFCGELSNPETGTAATLGGLAVFQGALHATTLKQDGFGLYRYGGGETWAYCGNPGRRVLNPCVFNGALHMVSYDAPGGPLPS
ncbi:MAG TPA: hypothetical protein PL005_15090 [Candidatus Hydrogenedentes bacterium]|nr:hypothetical protein [Candidatus Hydrogenedentota bacterium]